MYKYDTNKTHYRLMYALSKDKIEFVFVREKRTVPIDWIDELAFLYDFYEKEVSRRGEKKQFDIATDLLYLTPRMRCWSFIRMFNEYLPSDKEVFQPKPKQQLWTEAHLSKAEEGLPNRMKFIGKVSTTLFPEVEVLYRTISPLGWRTANRQLNVWQCTCGRYVVAPNLVKCPNRGYRSCGCLAGVDPKGARSARERILDAFREYATILLACYVDWSAHYDMKNKMNFGFWEFQKWYDKQVKGKPLNERFVRRIDKRKDFELENLKTIKKYVDRSNKTRYTDL